MSLYRILLVLTLSHSLANCHDLCSALKSGGQYRGVNVYKRYVKNNDYQFWMNNKNGIEWRIHIDSNDWNITADSTSITSLDPPLMYRMTLEEQDNITLELQIIDCSVVNKSIDCKDRANGTDRGSAPSYERSVIVGPYIAIKLRQTAYLELNKDNRNQKSVLHYNDYNQFSRNACEELPPVAICKDTFRYFPRMNDQLSTHLDSILFQPPFHVLFYNIGGRLHYCLLPYDATELSPQCKSPELMRTAFDECFTNDDNPTNLGLIIAICVIALIALIIVILVILYVIRRNRNSENLNKAHKGLDDSTTTATTSEENPSASGQSNTAGNTNGSPTKGKTAKKRQESMGSFTQYIKAFIPSATSEKKVQSDVKQKPMSSRKRMVKTGKTDVSQKQ